jgi:hypothetical protein
MTSTPTLSELRKAIIETRDAAVAALTEHHKAARAELERAADQELDRLRDLEGTGDRGLPATKSRTRAGREHDMPLSSG